MVVSTSSTTIFYATPSAGAIETQLLFRSFAPQNFRRRYTAVIAVRISISCATPATPPISCSRVKFLKICGFTAKKQRIRSFSRNKSSNAS